MVQFEVFRSGQKPVVHPVAALPCRIGRSGKCGLRLQEPGIWEEHVELSQGADDSFQISRVGEGSLILNGESRDDGRLVNGDTIELGATKLRFWLTPVRPRSQVAGDWMFWALVSTVLIAMVGLLLSLPH